MAKYKDNIFKYVIPKSLQEIVTKTRHSMSHQGIDASLGHVQSQYIWDKEYTSDETMLDTVTRVVRACLRCQFYSKKSKGPHNPVLPLLHMSRHRQCGQGWVLDLWHAGNNSKSPYKYMCAAVCVFCRRAEIKPLKNGTSTEVAQFVFEQLCQLQIPRFILSDHGSSVTQSEVQHLYDAVNSGLDNLKKQGKVPEDTPPLKPKVSSVYRPMSHSLIERFFSSYAQCLRRLLINKPDTWHLYAGRVTAISHYYILDGFWILFGCLDVCPHPFWP